MGRAAGLDTDQTGLEFAEERNYLATAQRLADTNLCRRIYAMNLKNVLRQI
jgi:hypothetical protein